MTILSAKRGVYLNLELRYKITTKNHQVMQHFMKISVLTSSQKLKFQAFEHIKINAKNIIKDVKRSLFFYQFFFLFFLLHAIIVNR